MNILLVEDNPGDARLIMEFLTDNDDGTFNFTIVNKLGEALGMIQERDFDVILLDLSLPDSLGLDTFYRMKLTAGNIPVVILTGHGDENLARKAVREGAQDYIAKDELSSKVLTRAVSYAIERQRTLMELQNMSFSDELTGLHNRRGFMLLAEEQLEIAKRQGKMLAVFFIDLDGMKTINDTFGHDEGDRALEDVASVIKEAFRKSDTKARLGGDEFAVCAQTAGENDGQLLKERILSDIDSVNNERKYELAVSVGICYYSSDAHRSISDMLNCADEQMYNEKKSKKKERK